MKAKDLSKLINEYKGWMVSTKRAVEHHIVLANLHPGDPKYQVSTDELRVRGYFLKGQNIHISRLTMNVYMDYDLFTFAAWLEQKSE